jgi:hypothetical protein
MASEDDFLAFERAAERTRRAAGKHKAGIASMVPERVLQGMGESAVRLASLPRLMVEASRTGDTEALGTLGGELTGSLAMTMVGPKGKGGAIRSQILPYDIKDKEIYDAMIMAMEKDLAMAKIGLTPAGKAALPPLPPAGLGAGPLGKSFREPQQSAQKRPGSRADIPLRLTEAVMEVNRDEWMLVILSDLYFLLRRIWLLSTPDN